MDAAMATSQAALSAMDAPEASVTKVPFTGAHGPAEACGSWLLRSCA
jgi:hypothetical protein